MEGGENMMLGYALAKAGLVDEQSVKAYEARRNLEAAVLRALKKAQRTGKSSDWEKYYSLRKRLPRSLRNLY